jgi:hypothetical protein
MQNVEIATNGTVKNDSYVNEEFEDLKKYCDMLGFPFKGRTSPFTAGLEKCFNNRKDNFSGLLLILKGYTKTTAKSELPKRDAANYLIEIIGDYDTIKKSTYSNATGEYNKVAEKLASKEATDAFNTIGIKAIFDETMIENENFKKLYDNKISSTPETPALAPAEIKKAIANHLLSILKYVDSKANRKVEGFTDAVNKINEIIADYSKVHKAEITRNENASTAATNGTETKTV